MTAYPADILSRYQPPPMGGLVDFPQRAELAEFAANTRKLTTQQADFGLRLLRETDWDLFFICFLTSDRIQHFFWRFWDQQDPTYPGPSPHSSVIPDFYKLHDGILGQFREAVGRDTALLVISDHGHGRRCVKGLYLNELLRRKGYLKSRTGRLGALDPKTLVERAKNAALRVAYDHDLEDWVYRLAKMIPRSRAIKRSTYIISKSESVAQIADFAGNNPFGGIEISREAAAANGLEYEALRTDLISALRNLNDPVDGKPIVDWVKKREELPEGEGRNRFPDIVYQLRPDYGTQRAMYTELLGRNPFHRKISGGHRESGILVAHGPRLAGDGAALPDLRPTILDLLDVEKEKQGDGRSLVR